MPILKNLEKLLKDSKVKYEIVAHRTVYTAFDKAKTLKIKPKEVAKTLTLKIGSGASAKYVLVSIPADKNFDKEKFKKLYNDWLKKAAKTDGSTTLTIKGKAFKAAKEISFADEKWIKKNIFKTKAGGAVPPFGSLFKVSSFVDKSLLKAKKLVVNAGGFEESMIINGSQIKNIEGLVWGSFSKAKK